MKKEIFGKTIVKYYDEIVNKGYHNQKKYISNLAKIIPKKSLVLELGCGTGQILISLLKKGILCEGIDNSKFMLEKLKSKKAKIYLSNLNSFKSKKKYDYIFSCHGPFLIKDNELESYILNKKELIKILKKYSKISKNGILINKGINKPSLKIKLKNNKIFIHKEVRQKNTMRMINQLFEKDKFVGEIVLIKKRYPLKNIFKNTKLIKEYKNFKQIKF